jgi:demethylmenaquinone methyltransferase/2-methoxy-6-polyprenyl-1,4-benzoquinol methylase
MILKRALLSNQSTKGYHKILKWLDSPARKKFNDPIKLISKADIKKGQTVLEIGCGSGFFTEEISKQVGNEGKVYATDIHPIAIDEIKKKIRLLGMTNVIPQIEDAISTSFEDNTFDMIILYGVVPAPIIPLRNLSIEMNRILKKDGVCAIWTAAPFWRPKKIIKYGKFVKLKRLYPVFRLQK